MHMALRRGEASQINWQVKAFLHWRLPHSGKEAKTKQKTKTIWEVHESDGNATVTAPSYVP